MTKPLRTVLVWRAVNILLVAALSLMVVFVFANAILRYFFNSGIPETEEMSRYLFVWVTALGSIVAFHENKHVGVDFLLNALTGKAQKVLIVFGQSLVCIAFGLVLWGGIEYFQVSAASPGPATGIPFGYVAISVCVIALAFIVMSFSKIADVFRRKQQ